MGGVLKKIYKNPLPWAVVSFAATTIKSLLSRETVRSSLRALARGVLTGSREKPYRKISDVERWADRIVEVFQSKGVSPEIIGIDGLPGSGKSTLGRALARRTGLTWKTLYWRDLEMAYPFQRSRIYENIRLFRTQDIEPFDVIIYLDCACEAAAARVVARDRDGTLADVLDFPLLKTIGDVAFEMAAGEEVRIAGSPLRIKLRPRGGYRDRAKLKGLLRKRGLETAGLGKEEMLFLYCDEKPQTGIYPYVKLGAYNTDIISGVSAATKALVERCFT